MSIPVPILGERTVYTWAQAVAETLNALTEEQGFMPYAYPMGYDPQVATSTQSNLAAVSSSKAGVMLVPFALHAPLALQSITIRSSDTASARSAEARIYLDTGSRQLPVVVGCATSWSFTPSAASDQTSNIFTPGTVLMPGTYWLTIRNTSASQTFGIRRQPNVTELVGNIAYQDNVPNQVTLPADELDTSLLSFTGLQGAPAVRLNGRVLGVSVAF